MSLIADRPSLEVRARSALDQLAFKFQLSSEQDGRVVKRGGGRSPDCAMPGQTMAFFFVSERGEQIFYDLIELS